jgi:hypothetical protein
MRVNVCGHRGAGIAGDIVSSAVGFDDLRSGVSRRDELGGVIFGRRAVQRISRRGDADQDQHDQAHALLAVIGAMKE